MASLPEKSALVVGATGGAGHAVARALVRRGWMVVALARNAKVAAKRFPDLAVRWVTGDAARASDVVGAAAGTRVIFHGANPPGYRNWRSKALPMLACTIDAAEATGARVIFPGNVYGYGADAGSVVNEASPMHPRTRKGKVRVEMEQTLQRAAEKRGVRTVVVRAGDFFGEYAPSSWVTTGMIKPGEPVRSVTYPGDAGSTKDGHSYAYLPDYAEAVAQIADREAELLAFDQFHFGGHYVARGIEFPEAIRRVAGCPDAPIKPMPWGLISLAQPFVPLFREILEMRYLWQIDLRLDNAKLVAFIGSEPHTPLDDALRATLVGLACLPPTATAASTTAAAAPPAVATPQAAPA